jgi:hypothetical protein
MSAGNAVLAVLRLRVRATARVRACACVCALCACLRVCACVRACMPACALAMIASAWLCVRARARASVVRAFASRAVRLFDRRSACAAERCLPPGDCPSGMVREYPRTPNPCHANKTTSPCMGRAGGRTGCEPRCEG